MWYSTLSNGTMVHGLVKIGTMVLTQWGPRAVVGHSLEPVSCTPDMPRGC